MSKLITARAAALAATLAITAGSALAEDYPDMRGEWTASYLAVAPTNANGKGPRFGQSEWTLDIQQQQENVFWGISKWRRNADTDWIVKEATGNISVSGSGAVGMLETSPDPDIGVTSTIDGVLSGDMLTVDFRNLRTGATYSTELHRTR